ncbi:MAG: hypothetical protein R2939_19280 [Kofleriaceae bacterium]
MELLLEPLLGPAPARVHAAEGGGRPARARRGDAVVEVVGRDADVDREDRRVHDADVGAVAGVVGHGVGPAGAAAGEPAEHQLALEPTHAELVEVGVGVDVEVVALAAAQEQLGGAAARRRRVEIDAPGAQRRQRVMRVDVDDRPHRLVGHDQPAVVDVEPRQPRQILEPVEAERAVAAGVGHRGRV